MHLSIVWVWAAIQALFFVYCISVVDSSISPCIVCSACLGALSAMLHPQDGALYSFPFTSENANPHRLSYDSGQTLTQLHALAKRVHVQSLKAHTTFFTHPHLHHFYDSSVVHLPFRTAFRCFKLSSPIPHYLPF